MKDTTLLMAVGLVVQTLWRILGILELISQKILNPGLGPGPGQISEAWTGIGRDWKGRDIAGTGIPVDLYYTILGYLRWIVDKLICEFENTLVEHCATFKDLQVLYPKSELFLDSKLLES